MIPLFTYSVTQVLLTILTVSLILLIAFILYKKLLTRLGKGLPVAKDYCVLYSLEQNPVKGEMEIYFTSELPKTVKIELLNEDMSVNTTIAEKEYADGGHIVRFDTLNIPDGNYFYCLKTDNQKTMKKVLVKNS
jgi:hypothetical protein